MLISNRSDCSNRCRNKKGESAMVNVETLQGIQKELDAIQERIERVRKLAKDYFSAVSDRDRQNQIVHGILYEAGMAGRKNKSLWNSLEALIALAQGEGIVIVLGPDE
jgi:hypothetical protein